MRGDVLRIVDGAVTIATSSAEAIDAERKATAGDKRYDTSEESGFSHNYYIGENIGPCTDECENKTGKSEPCPCVGLGRARESIESISEERPAFTWAIRYFAVDELQIVARIL